MWNSKKKKNPLKANALLFNKNKQKKNVKMLASEKIF